MLVKMSVHDGSCLFMVVLVCSWWFLSVHHGSCRFMVVLVCSRCVSVRMSVHDGSHLFMVVFPVCVSKNVCLYIALIRPENLYSVREWIKQLPSYGLDSVDCGSHILDTPQVAAIEQAVKDMQVK